MTNKRLYRSEDDKMLGGVCGGIAEVYEFDPALVRLITLLLILSGITPLIYIVAWIVIPSKSELKTKNKVKDVEAEEIETEE
jgi:Putative stress-responsive transcriptional regulator